MDDAKETTREQRLAEALDRIARYAEAFEATTEKLGHDGTYFGPALAITLGRYARRVLDG